MKFEHLIEINDPLNPLIDSLTREQLWRGLVLHAESPKLFVPHLDECDISERSDSGFSRRLRYGELVIEDKVTLLPQLQVCWAATARAAASLDAELAFPLSQCLAEAIAALQATPYIERIRAARIHHHKEPS